MNTELLKTLTLLYAEDDEQVRESLSDLLHKLFKKVLIAHDGMEALKFFHSSKENGVKIDLIVSDITMPNMTGLELLSNIRKLDMDVPFIFTTAYTDSESLLLALQQGATDYFVKPINNKALIGKIGTICSLQREQNEIEHYQQETQRHLDIINNVAIISVVDEKGYFTYVNDFFLEVSHYSEKEMLDKHLHDLIHPDTDKNILSKQWKVLQENKEWKGKLKYLAKNGEIFYTNTTIVPIASEDKINYVSVMFVTTKDENERREYKKKVLYNLQETKRINQVTQKKIVTLEEELQQYKSCHKVEQELDSYKKKSSEYYTAIKTLESSIDNLKHQYESRMSDSSNEIREMLTQSNGIKAQLEMIQDKSEVLKREIHLKEELIENLLSQDKRQKKKIKDLKDVLSYRSSQFSKS